MRRLETTYSTVGSRSTPDTTHKVAAARATIACNAGTATSLPRQPHAHRCTRRRCATARASSRPTAARGASRSTALPGEPLSPEVPGRPRAVLGHRRDATSWLSALTPSPNRVGSRSGTSPAFGTPARARVSCRTARPAGDIRAGGASPASMHDCSLAFRARRPHRARRTPDRRRVSTLIDWEWAGLHLARLGRGVPLVQPPGRRRRTCTRRTATTVGETTVPAVGARDRALASPVVRAGGVPTATSRDRATSSVHRLLG